MPLRETRRFKTRGFVISFGDIMLPLVGIVAVGLLLVAGKLFFLSGLQPDRVTVPVISSPPPVARQEKSAQAETPPVARPVTKTISSVPVVPKPVSADTTANEGRRSLGATLDVLAVPYDSRATAPTEAPAGKSVTVEKTEAPSAPKNTQQRPPVKERLTRPSQTVKTTPTPSAAEKKSSTPPPAPAKPSWLVQVGAFSTQAAAEAVVQQLGKAGYSGTIVSGKTLHRVLVQAGVTRDEALTMATKMSKSGFQGAFIVPPRQ